MLAADETEAVAKFEQEGLQPRDQAVFEFTFLDRLPEAKKLEVVGTL